MTIAKLKGPHESRAVATCDQCSYHEEVSCGFTKGRSGKPPQPNEGQVVNKLVRQGWSNLKGTLRCPKCEGKRREELATTSKQKEPTSAEAPNEPSRAQKRQIMDMLETCYDTEHERYVAGDTDDTIADVLGVMPGWVSKLREEFFGPDGANEDMGDLEAKIIAMERDIAAIKAQGEKVKDEANRLIEQSQTALACAQRKLAEVSVLKSDLDKIKKAVGPRVCRNANVG